MGEIGAYLTKSFLFGLGRNVWYAFDAAAARSAMSAMLKAFDIRRTGGLKSNAFQSAQKIIVKNLSTC